MKNIFLNLFFFVKIYCTNIIKDEFRKIIPEKYLDVIQESYKNILILTDKSFHIYPFSFFSSSYENLIEFQNNKNYFYSIIDRNLYIEYYIFDKNKIICNFQGKNISITISSYNNETIDFNSIKISKYNNKGFIIVWYTLKNKLEFRIIDNNYNEVKKHVILLRSHNYESSNIFVDFFSNDSFLIGYDDKSENIIKVYDKSINEIYTFKTLIIYEFAPFIKILNDHFFIICTRYYDKINNCRICKINDINFHNYYKIRTFGNIYDITPISKDKFILFYIKGRKNKNLYAEIFDFDGIQKADFFLIKNKKQVDLMKIFFSEEKNKILFLYSINEQIFIERAYLDIQCSDFEKIINKKHINKCIKLIKKREFDLFIKTGVGKNKKINLRLIEFPNNGIIYNKKDNFFKAEIDKDYNITDLCLLINNTVYNSENEINIKYKVINEFYDESFECNINFKINNDENIKKKTKHYDKYSIYVSNSLLILILTIIIISFISDYLKEKKLKYSKLPSEYLIYKHYIKLFCKLNLTTFAELNNLIFQIIDRYNFLYKPFSIYNPFYSKLTRSVYLITKILIIYYFGVLGVITTSPSDDYILIFIKNAFIYTIISYILSIIIFAILNRLIYKNCNEFNFYFGQYFFEDIIKIYSCYQYVEIKKQKERKLINKKIKEYNKYFSYEINQFFLKGLFLLLISIFGRYIYSLLKDNITEENFPFLMFNILIEFIEHFIIAEIINLYIYTIILNYYCYDIHTQSSEKNGELISLLYTLVIPPYIDIDYFICEIYSNWFIKNINIKK